MAEKRDAALRSLPAMNRATLGLVYVTDRMIIEPGGEQPRQGGIGIVRGSRKERAKWTAKKSAASMKDLQNLKAIS
jgi:hypothetical protein